MAKIDKILKDKQHAKIGGILVDTFSASILMQVYDKVNDSNKERMNKMSIQKLANVLQKVGKTAKL